MKEALVKPVPRITGGENGAEDGREYGEDYAAQMLADREPDDRKNEQEAQYGEVLVPCLP